MSEESRVQCRNRSDTRFKTFVHERIKGDKRHGWGVEDSVAIIESLIAEDAPDGYAPSEDLMKLVAIVVNPSAFRQQLEKAGDLVESGKKRAKGSAWASLGEFND